MNLRLLRAPVAARQIPPAAEEHASCAAGDTRPFASHD
jgi:hypothetical protein